MRISGKKMSLYKINKELKLARYNDFISNQLKKPSITFYSHLQHNNMEKFPIRLCRRQFFRIISQSREYINAFCNDMENAFQFA